MTAPEPFTVREAGILCAIVEAYIETGEPVASLALARLQRMNLSAASIRNVMSELAEKGFLSQPHASAGRLPTEKAIETYVKSIAVKIVSAELAQMRAELRRSQTVEARVTRSSQILTQLTRNVGIVAAIPTSNRFLSHVELVAIPPSRILMVVVTSDGHVSNQVVELNAQLEDGQLIEIRNYLNLHFHGWRLPEVRAELERRLAQESAAYDSVLRALLQLQMRGLLDLALDPEIHLDGTSNLVGIDLHMTREAMRDLFRTLEQKKRLLELLDRFLEQDSETPGVQIGLGEIHPSMGNLSLVGLTVRQENGLSTKVAVLGPRRMDYARALSAIVQMQQALRSLPA